MRSAEALKKAAGILYPEAEVDILDTFRYASPFLEKVVVGTYMEILKMSPVVYGYLYRQAERGQPLSGRGKMEFNRILSILTAPRLENYINKFRPEAIICTHPFPLGVISFMKKRGAYRGPLHAVITDFTVHSFWIFPEVDRYFVGAEPLTKQCEEFGIGPERVSATGIPIDPAFNATYDKHELKKQLGLDPVMPVALIMGGGLGMGPLASAVKNLGKNISGLQLIVVAGTNKALQEKLLKMTPELALNVKIFGFVDNIHHLMAVADLMVGKAGGLTCAEALAMGLPLFIVDPLPGQEERNAEFITAAGAGIKVDGGKLAETVRFYFENTDKLQEMTRAAAALGKPSAAFDVWVRLNDS
ncbi:MAG: glycosyltransferase [Pelotomaculum sp.]|uniref:UDP-N-acetylglucosamine:LPS N-acetylglucosamine transferase n=1 Tax=Pelotomaculum thermopropionicum (strain DSM 13744 / JCM 10971 / SI) TaxID=370438 RepID=A5D2U7_PELTS|nr:glycosyltransferase [Pelotomaculum sp.]BAF59445.1 UDP-N-acetylglucosamine:LPS N-acetylglucosamine transferase [Pelotomaculum thermopropionicum SI]